MSTPLKDFRLGITESIDIWLDAVAAAHNLDKAAIARDVLQEWADLKAHEHTIARRRMSANGLQPDLPGLDTEDAGTRRHKAKR
jgi:hypothetical protein